MAKIQLLEHRIIHKPEGHLRAPGDFLLGNQSTLERILILKFDKLGLGEKSTKCNINSNFTKLNKDRP